MSGPITETQEFPHVRYLSARGHGIACLLHNQEASGIPVVFIHGMTASVRFWEAAMYEPIRRDHPWYSLSLPYHHPSTFPENAVMDEYILADLMEECFQQLLPDGRDFILVGYSLGAFAALNYAAKYPVRVASIISIGGMMNGKAKGLEGVLMNLSKGNFFRKSLFHLGWRIMALHPFFLKVAVFFYAADYRALWHYDCLDETLRNIFPDVKRHPVEKIRQFFRYLIGMNVMDEVRKLTMPVLVIAGEADPVIPYAHQLRCAEALPHSTFLSLPGTGHVAFGERPEVVRTAIVDWIKNSASTTSVPERRL